VSIHVFPNPALWTTREPSEWASAPEWMSFHTFKDAQICPLAASLRNSYYASIWAKKGYPSRPNVAAITGTIVHICAERIVRQLVEEGIATLMDPAAMALLRKAGGFSKILQTALEDYQKKEQSNPRFVHFQDELLRSLRTRLPQMRATLQELLASHDWSAGATLAVVKKIEPIGSTDIKQGARAPLGMGAHMEVELVDASIGWRGVADVVVLSVDGCRIIDFKTGRPDQEHRRQMWVYAMLWNCDRETNPGQVPVKKLTLIYTSGSVDVPVPSREEMAAFRKSLIEGSEDLKDKLGSKRVPATPSVETCRYCQVKLLCDAYWKDLPAHEPGERFSNAELELVEKRGDRGWLAQVRSHKNLAPGEQLLLRCFESGSAFWSDLRPGLSLRVTDATLSIREPDDIPALNLSMLSEALFLT
jgi:PD-(D/E)XK nuclease superfamily